MQTVGAASRNAQFHTNRELFICHIYCIMGSFKPSILGHLGDSATKIEELWHFILHDSVVVLRIFNHQIPATYDAIVRFSRDNIHFCCDLHYERNIHSIFYARDKRQNL